jgi:hypothetical protein
MMRFTFLLSLALPVAAFANEAYPTGPNPQLTPGSLCARPTAHRYPEHIPYCDRSVSSGLKKQIIHEYDVSFGYRIEQMNRGDFKIDHYIPLCMGGSNDHDNLWPQHVSVYTVTDRLEQVLCDRMSDGELQQRDAVTLIREAKNDLSKVPGILQRYAH